MRRRQTQTKGVVVYEDVPIHAAPEQGAYACLNLAGVPRDLPTHTIRVFLHDDDVDHRTSAARRSHAGEYMTYNSPPTPGPARAAAPDKPLPRDQGLYEVQIDVSEAMRGLRPDATEADVTLVLVDLAGEPMDAAPYQLEAVSISRRA